MNKEEVKINNCAECGGKLTGCTCSWRKTPDTGKLIHRNCKKQYESKMKKTKTKK
tara:strand:+ start:3966 stop:4130 length:165 start_codon:yes stop_codon:yes gene_type:complete